MLAQHRRSSRLAIALLTVITLVLTLFPGLPERASAASQITISRSDFVTGYAPTPVTLTGTDTFKFKSDTRVLLFNQNNTDTRAVSSVQVTDNKTLTFMLQPGLVAGRYTLLVVSYSQATLNLNVLTSYDPTNVTVTPGANSDIRVDWTDPNALDINDIVIQYSLLNQTNFTSQSVPRGVQTYTFKGLQNKKAYKIRLYANKRDGTRTNVVEMTNGGLGYIATDTTPPGDLTNLTVRSIANGFRLTWTDPVGQDNPSVSDLSLITVQYAEHGTNTWSEGFVVAKGVQAATVSPINTAKRYDFRFTKLDLNGNWNYQVDTHNGYGYTWDTDSPNEVSSLATSNSSDTSTYITWYDPTNTDFHHVNFYLRSNLSTEWVSVGRADKGLQNFQLNGLSPGIDYTLRVTSIDQLGNETPGVTRSFRTNSINDLAALTNVEIKQEISGGLQITWKSDAMANVDFNRFKMFYAPLTSNDPKDYKVTEVSNRGTKSGSLRDMPRGLYKLEMRLVDTYGLMQTLQAFNNSGNGWYVSGNGSNLPSEVGNVKVLAPDGINLDLTWDASTTNGTHVQLYVAERSPYPSWRLLGKVDKRDQRFTARGLTSSYDYFFKLVVVDSNRNNLESAGVIYDNSGYGFNVIGGDRHAPHEVTNAGAQVNGNALVVSYLEPTDTDFSYVNLYAQKMGSNDPINPINISRGNNGTTINDLVPGTSYLLRLTTVDNFGNESTGVTLNNNGAGYSVQAGTSQSTNEVRNVIVIPNTNQLTVRFQDPTAADYQYTTVSIKKSTETAFTNERNLSKGTNETTYTGLEPNASYLVRLVTTSTSGKKSNGLTIGGNNGIPMSPIANVSNARVTPGANRLTVTWNDPTVTIPTGILVEYQQTGRSAWSEPVLLQPNTGFMMFGGLSNQAHKIRITALRNEIGSPSLILDSSANNGSGPGFTPRDVSFTAAPSHLQVGTAGQTQWVSLIGKNARFTSSSSTDVSIYNSSGGFVPDAIKQTSIYSGSRIDILLRRDLPVGTYTARIRSNEDGLLETTFTVQTAVVQPEATTLGTAAVNLGYSPFQMTVNGSGFNSSTRIQIDSGSTITPSTTSDGKSLSFQMPSGLLPGVHKVYVTTDNATAIPMQFTVHPFRSQVSSLNPPGMRTGPYQGEWSVTNLDPNPRSAKVILLIRRNGQFMEAQETTLSFNGLETKKIKLDFGGNNTPYSVGPTHSLTVQAFVVDSTSQTPLAEAVIHEINPNL